MGVASLVLLIVLGLALIAIGLRGRVVRHGPTCRACAFDLSGLATPLVTCPECGKSLTTPRSVRPLLRRPRVIPLLTGGVLLLALVSLLVAAGSGRLASPAVQSRLPQAVLRIEARFCGPELAQAALKEAISRMGNNEFDAAILREWANTALLIQAQTQRPWFYEWGDIVSRARAAKLVSDEEWVAFADRGLEITLAARSPVAPNAPMALQFGLNGNRSRSPGAGNTLLRMSIQSIRVLDHIAPIQAVAAPVVLCGGPLGTVTCSTVAPSTTGAGTVVAELRFTFEHVSDGKPLELPSFSRTVSCPVEIIAGDASSIAAVPPREDLSPAIRCGGFQVLRGQNSDVLRGTIHADELSTAVACLILVRLADGTEVPLQEHVFRGNDGLSLAASIARLPVGTERVDILLRPSRAAAETAIDVRSYLDTEIVLRDIPVTDLK